MKFEKFDWQGLGPSPIIGVDEVGRGCLAGRVYAAAVIFTGDDQFDEYTDSKLLSVERRKILTEKILKKHKVGIGFATAQEIDKINIFQATFVAMKRAIQNLNVNSGHVLVDGKFPIPNLKGFQQTPLIKGDLRAAPISAASIVAKVTRDEYMEEMAKKYNQYGFEKHKGYSTAEHMEQIRVWGPCTEHRKTFRGVKEYVPTSSAGLEI